MNDPIRDTAMSTAEREQGARLVPRFDDQGLVTAIVTDAGDGAVLMVAHMNAEALALTQSSGEAYFWSRSRARLWRKGEESGHVLTVVELRVDCDQDAVQVIARPAGPSCHTGERSCFYRRIVAGGLERL